VYIFLIINNTNCKVNNYDGRKIYMESNKQNINEILGEDNQEVRNKKYNDYVESITPKHNLCRNVVRAFIVGGIICTVGQVLLNIYKGMGASMDDAKLYSTISLIFLSVLFTGLGWYSKLAKFAGAGSLVPITGFANSITAPAVEYKTEGQVFGIGCKIFTIAGPVILYGLVSSWVLGLIYWIFK
jgi:stage V sporulation protein AC